MPIQFLAALVISLALNSSALADASDQGCASSGNNANGCLGDVLAAPGPLAEGGILLIAVGLFVVLKARGGRKKEEINAARSGSKAGIRSPGPDQHDGPA